MRPELAAAALLALAACASNAGETKTAASASANVLVAAPKSIHFERKQLSAEFFAEGATFGDLDGDGVNDVIAGPYWYPGPEFQFSWPLYKPKAFDPAHYSDNFFAWTDHIDGDKWLDIVVVGFPGKESYWLRNKYGGSLGGEGWERCEIVESVDNESPHYVDLTGDGARELVYMTGGRFTWAERDRNDPKAAWKEHSFSEDYKLGPYVHGLGVGDIDGDGRKDVLWKNGWFQQPESLAGDPLWKHHDFSFSAKHGGAQMLVYDVDGDGDNDVITSLAAHEFGLSWFEQVRDGGALTFVEHRFMDDEPSDNAQGVCCSELHALDLVDVDGDGLKDVVTGKRWWSHGHKGDPQPNIKPGLYWFQLVRGANGPEFVAHLADDQSGVGTQVTAGDVDGDGLVDMVVSNKRGTFVVNQRRWTDAERLAHENAAPTLDFENGVRGWTADGDAFALQPIFGDTVKARGREPSLHEGNCWIGGYEKLGDGSTGTLTSNPIRIVEPFASFLVGGGGSPATRVELVLAENGEVIFKSSGADFESMQRVVADLSKWRFRPMRIRLVDEEKGGWGHLNFDDFRFHAERPSFDAPKGVPSIRPWDTVANAGLTAQEAAAAMTVPEGFHVDVIAAEPDVHQPIALAIDDNGRLWVAEAHTYPVRAPEGQGKDNILVFEDADHDGSFEKRTVFASGLNLVSGLEIGFGGVWVGAAPYLLFIPDANGDLVPDGEPKVLLDGWGYEDTHETLNAFTWGPDGWLYGCHGVFTNSLVGKPGTPKAERTPLNAGVWRYHPVRHEFEVFAHGTSNPWGVDFDENGEAFVTACVIPHLFHIVQGGRYERQSGSHFEKYTFDDIKTIADHRHYIGDTPHSGNNRSAEAGGGHAHCGLLIYQGEQFPKEYRGGLFFENIHGNRINHDVVEPKGSGFVGKHKPDLLLANDRWFRGISFKEGPDGSVYFIDWYDTQACHWTDPGIWDRTNGRIYRLRYGELRTGVVDVNSNSAGSGLMSPSENSWVARRRLRQLAERPEAHLGLVQELEFLVMHGFTGERWFSKAFALCALHALGRLEDERDLYAHLSLHQDEQVRAWSVQLALEDKRVGMELLGALESAARSDSSPIVRRYLASGLQRLPLAQRWEIAKNLAAHAEDNDDPNLPFLVWYGVEPLVAAEPARALATFGSAKLEKVARFTVRRAAAEPALHSSLVTHLTSFADDSSLKWRLEESVKALGDQRGLVMPAAWPALRARIEAKNDAALSKLGAQVALAFGDTTSLPELRRRMLDKSLSGAERSAALNVLIEARDPVLKDSVKELLVDTGTRTAAIRAISLFDDSVTAQVALAMYASANQDERRELIDALTSRASFASLLLDAIEDQRVKRSDLGAFAARKIESFGDPKLSERLAVLWGTVKTTANDKLQRIAALKQRLTPDVVARGDRARGRELFSRTCQQCHTLFGTGGDVGPELTGANRADLDYLLSNIVDPSGVVGQDYLSTMVWTHDERLVTGILKEETDSSIVLRTERERLVIPKSEIESRRTSEVSTMPEGQLDTLQPDEIVNLIAYLQGASQANLRATPLNAGRLFDGETLAYWRFAGDVWKVEGGEIVGRGELARNSFLASELELGDFTLEFEVKLVGDEGNSGVQFRSSVHDDGEVAGYQADIGPGWWGKLYEEHGRAVLWDKSGETHVKKGEWNRYAIEAKGSRIVTRLNGETCVDLDDPTGARRGVIALQLHSGGKTEVRFRNFRLQVLD
jgi:putative membrane-bound dehydrogenase-like protein